MSAMSPLKSSPLSGRITDAFYPPDFLPPVMIIKSEMDARMEAGLDTFAAREHAPRWFSS